jgi:putative membrane protein
MNIYVQVFALLAAVVHVYIFCIESLWFMKPEVYKKFGAASIKEAEYKRVFAFNQGFYNLFLAIGIFLGIALMYFGTNTNITSTLVLFSCANMFGAAIVLYFSGGPKMLKPTVMQGIFPLLTWISWLGL